MKLAYYTLSLATRVHISPMFRKCPLLYIPIKFHSMPIFTLSIYYTRVHNAHQHLIHLFKLTRPSDNCLRTKMYTGMILERGLAGFPQNNSDARLFKKRMRPLVHSFLVLIKRN